MNQSLALVAIVVRDYDAAIGFYVGTLGFELVEEQQQKDGRLHLTLRRTVY